MSGIESGLDAINVNEMVKILSKSYISLIKTNTPFKMFPSVMLWGPPGVGKSQGVREIAKVIEGVLFVSGEGVEIDEFKTRFDINDREFNKCLDMLKEKYNEKSGINMAKLMYAVGIMFKS